MTREEFTSIAREEAFAEIESRIGLPDKISLTDDKPDLLIRGLNIAVIAAVKATLKTLEKAGFIKFDD